MRNSLIIALVFLLSMTCHAQKISMSALLVRHGLQIPVMMDVEI